MHRIEERQNTNLSCPSIWRAKATTSEAALKASEIWPWFEDTSEASEATPSDFVVSLRNRFGAKRNEELNIRSNRDNRLTNAISSRGIPERFWLWKEKILWSGGLFDIGLEDTLQIGNVGLSDVRAVRFHQSPKTIRYIMTEINIPNWYIILSIMHRIWG